jgi:hypothetical protein
LHRLREIYHETNNSESKAAGATGDDTFPELAVRFMELPQLRSYEALHRFQATTKTYNYMKGGPRVRCSGGRALTLRGAIDVPEYMTELPTACQELESVEWTQRWRYITYVDDDKS